LPNLLLPAVPFGTTRCQYKLKHYISENNCHAINIILMKKKDKLKVFKPFTVCTLKNKKEATERNTIFNKVIRRAFRITFGNLLKYSLFAC